MLWMAAGRTVKLDLYEGLPHVFQGQLPDTPESAGTRNCS